METACPICDGNTQADATTPANLPLRLWHVASDRVIQTSTLCSNCAAEADYCVVTHTTPRTVPCAPHRVPVEWPVYGFECRAFDWLRRWSLENGMNYVWLDIFCIAQFPTDPSADCYAEVMREREREMLKLGDYYAKSKLVLVILQSVSAQSIKSLSQSVADFKKVYTGQWGPLGWQTDLPYESLRSNPSTVDLSYQVCLSWMPIEKSPFWSSTVSLLLLTSPQIAFKSEYGDEYIRVSDIPDINDIAATVDRVTNKSMAFFQQVGCTDAADLLSRWVRLKTTKIKLSSAEILGMMKSRSTNSTFEQDWIYDIVSLFPYRPAMITYSKTIREISMDILKCCVENGDVSVLTYLSRPYRTSPFTCLPDLEIGELEFLDDSISGQPVDIAFTSKMEFNGQSCGPFQKTKHVLSRDASPLSQIYYHIGEKLNYKEFLAILGVSAKIGQDVWDKCSPVVLRGMGEPCIEKLSQEELSLATLVSMNDGFGDIKAEMTNYLALRELLFNLDSKLRKLVECTTLTICESTNSHNGEKAYVLLIGSSTINKFMVMDVGLTSETSPVYIAVSGDKGNFVRVGVTYKPVGVSLVRRWTGRVRSAV